jgi:hypothetical protein
MHCHLWREFQYPFFPSLACATYQLLAHKLFFTSSSFQFFPFFVNSCLSSVLFVNHTSVVVDCNFYFHPGVHN